MTLSKIPLDFEENSIPMVIYNEDNQSIIEVNKEACELYGYDREELLSLALTDLETEEAIPEPLKRLERQQEKYNAHFWEHKTCEGKSILVDILTQTVSHENKKQVLAIVQDVTLLGQKEFRDQVFQRILTCLQDNLPALFYLFDEEGNLKQWNSYVENTTGYSYDEISSMKTTDFFAEEEESEVIQAINKMYKEGEAELKTQLSSKSGEKIPILFRAVKVKHEDRVFGMGIGLNLSNLVEAEKEAAHHRQILEAVIDQSPSLMYIKDNENRFRFANKAFLQLHGLDHDEIIGKKDSEVLRDYDIELMRKTDRQVRQTGQMCNIREEVKVNGGTRTYLSTKLQLNNIEGYENYLFSMSTDITKQREMEKMLKKSLKQKEVLLSEIHYRVKNNLAVISAIMELEVFDSEDSRLQERLNKNLSRIKTMAFIHEILYQEQDVSQIEFGNNITGLVNTITATFEEKVEVELNVNKLGLNINQALPCSLIINEVVTNIINDNTEQGKEVYLAIELSIEGQNVILRITDKSNGKPNYMNGNRASSISDQLIQTLKKQLIGTFKVTSGEDGKTSFELYFKREQVKGTSSSLFEYPELKIGNF